MYASLQIPWSLSPTPAETLYHASGMVRTAGTIFLLPPSPATLRVAFNAPPRPKTRMSSGAVALCKHFERQLAPIPAATAVNGSEERPENAAQSYKLLKRKEGDAPHPYWDVPRGSNEEKTRIAEGVLVRVLESAVWRNVVWLHEGVAVYEVRVREGWGMRWSLGVERANLYGGATSEDKGEGATGEDEESVESKQERSGGTPVAHGRQEQPLEEGKEREWRIKEVTFRGLLEPIAGLNHELDLPSQGTSNKWQTRNEHKHSKEAEAALNGSEMNGADFTSSDADNNDI